MGLSEMTVEMIDLFLEVRKMSNNFSSSFGCNRDSNNRKKLCSWLHMSLCRRGSGHCYVCCCVGLVADIVI